MNRRPSQMTRLAHKAGLVLAGPEDLTWSRRKAGTGFSYRDETGAPIRDAEILSRLAAQAVPPAYQDVRYAPDPRAHLQAIGRDAAGRLQYRYHPDWEKVREVLKARRLAKLADALPTLRRALGRGLADAGADRDPTKEFALAAVIELVALTAIRAGGEAYARARGTRGATTLLKSNVTRDGDRVVIRFKAKGGQKVEKDVCVPRFAAAIARLHRLPGRRLFQYRDAEGTVRPVRADEVNRALKEMSGAPISLKDFRTLVASASVLETLARAVPAGSARARRSQVLEAVRDAAEALANTPTVCRKSYVHGTIVTAFEDGVLERFSATLKGCRSPARRAEVLAQIVATSRLEAAE
ncbi:DNA topoisomerase IB [Roseixanthobacter pseudopolyaromaticivorans]|uniref:DNA topoisomerase IB n=1 Tax=Xanthobacteraceae TaxID=335928 RepID=UPI00372D0BD2